jgi:hypothetical protein
VAVAELVSATEGGCPAIEATPVGVEGSTSKVRKRSVTGKNHKESTTGFLSKREFDLGIIDTDFEARKKLQTANSGPKAGPLAERQGFGNLPAQKFKAKPMPNFSKKKLILKPSNKKSIFSKGE